MHRRAEGDVAVLFVEVDLGARRGGVGGGRRGADELVVGELVSLAERREGVLVEVGSVVGGDFGLRVLAEPGDVVRGLRVGDGVEGVLVVDEERVDAQLFVGEGVVFVAEAQAGVDLVEFAVAADVEVEADTVAGVEGDGGEVGAGVVVVEVVRVNGAGEGAAEVGKFAHGGGQGFRAGVVAVVLGDAAGAVVEGQRFAAVVAFEDTLFEVVGVQRLDAGGDFAAGFVVFAFDDGESGELSCAEFDAQGIAVVAGGRRGLGQADAGKEVARGECRVARGDF